MTKCFTHSDNNTDYKGIFATKTLVIYGIVREGVKNNGIFHSGYGEKGGRGLSKLAIFIHIFRFLNVQAMESVFFRGFNP